MAATPDAARTLGGTPVVEMPVAAAGGASDPAPPAPLAETVGVDGPPLGMSDPYAARLPGGGGAPPIIGAGVPADAAGGGAGVWLAIGVVAAAGGGADAAAGVTFVAA
ncbi:hypothetical protein [Mycobacterium sp. ITM-2016-00318]|uniref:hypothetical protein n=1 Tax=Mycobacterium sp. ITM-2016-00318 TaxID=2099693 RepID=UPI0011572847|nr:hypothetical protein [Mycobacterium sp. ITM-2016-00318]WNG92480.1 hypothetical protein C6A82_024295 [Mycobacterium sp. ITM-2016-00318]